MMDPTAFLDLVTKAGPWAVAILLFIGLRLERQERLDTQKWLRDFLERDAHSKELIAASLRTLRLALYTKGSIPESQVLDGDFSSGGRG